MGRLIRVAELAEHLVADINLRRAEDDDGVLFNKDKTVVLKATSGGTLDMELTPTTTESDFSGNELKGTTASMTGAAGNIYVLNAKSGTGAGFYKLSPSGTLGANKAYLTYTVPAGAAAREFFGFGETTGIYAPTARHAALWC